MENNNLSTNTLGSVWNEAQGSYSEELANKIINFESRQRLRFRSVLDICCGSGNLLRVMQNNGKICYGTETIDDFIDYNKQINPEISIIKTNTILDFDKIKTFDLITCTNKVINNLSDISYWREFFDLVYNNLNNGGVFVFDFFTENKLDGWNETTHKETDTYDRIRTVSTKFDGSPISEIKDVYYLKTTNSEDKTKYKRVEYSDKKYAFKNENIIKEITNAKFRYLIPVDANLKPIQNLNYSKTAYIIAIKREG